MDRWSGHIPASVNFPEYKPSGERSYRVIILLVATTTFLSPLFALGSFSEGWVIDSQGLPDDFKYTKLDMLNSASSGQMLSKVYNPDYEGPYFEHLPIAIRSLLILGYIISLLTNILFPLKILGPWRFRCSGLPSFLYILQAISVFHTSYLNKSIPPDRLVFSTSYYAAIISSVLCLISSLSLFIDYYLLSKLFKNHQGVGISPSLMVLSCCLVLPSLWCHVGAYVYEILEGWHPILGFYFSLATITTIGFGDFQAKTSGGRLFLFIHTLLGIVLMVGLASSVKSAFKEIFLSGKAERIRRKSSVANSPLDRYQTNNTMFTGKLYLDLGMLKTHLILALLNFILLCLLRAVRVLGALFFMTLETWPFFESLYFSFVTFSTIGYGDITIKTYPGLLAFSCYTIYGMVAMSYFISVVAEGWIQKFASRSRSIEVGWWNKLNRAPEHWPYLLAPPLTSSSNPSLPQTCENPQPCSSLSKFLRHQHPKQESPETPWQFQL